MVKEALPFISAVGVVLSSLPFLSVLFSIFVVITVTALSKFILGRL